MPKKYVIALYIRLSMEDIKTDSYSISNQSKALREYAEGLAEYDDAEILEFVDNGYSGTNFERPSMRQLLDLVRSGKVDCIIVRDFTRFGRNSVETGYFLERVFPVFYTRFISINDNFDSQNYKGQTAGIEVAFKYLIGEYYSKDLSKKSKTAKYAKMARGEYQSKICPYGYKKGEDGRMAIDDEAAQVVRLVFSLSLKGFNGQQICRALYEQKIPTPGEYKAARGNKTHDVSKTHGIWQRSTVLRMLVDERYAGTYIIGKREVTEVGGHKVRMKAEHKWFKIPEHHASIVDMETFLQVQDRLRHFVSKKVKFKEFPLRGKVLCGCCGHALTRIHKAPVFICRHSQMDSDFDCHGLQITELDLEAVIFDMLNKQAQVILNVASLDNIDVSSLQSSEQMGYERQIQNCREESKLVYEQYFRKEIDSESYTQQTTTIDSEIKRLTASYKALLRLDDKKQKDNEEQSGICHIAQAVSDADSLTSALADMMIEKVFVYPGNRLDVIWKVASFFGETGL